jgi:hypothetical protein
MDNCPRGSLPPHAAKTNTLAAATLRPIHIAAILAIRPIVRTVSKPVNTGQGLDYVEMRKCFDSFKPCA